MRRSLNIESDDGVADSRVEGIGVSEGLMSQMIGFEVPPDIFDLIEFRRIFRQPFHCEPVRASGEGGQRRFAGMDRAVVEDDYGRFGLKAGLGAMRPIERFKQSDEIGAAFGPGGRNDKFALRLVERAHHGDFLGLPWRWNA